MSRAPAGTNSPRWSNPSRVSSKSRSVGLGPKCLCVEFHKATDTAAAYDGLISKLVTVISTALWSAYPMPLFDFAYRVFDLYRKMYPEQTVDTWTTFCQKLIARDVRLSLQGLWPTTTLLEQFLLLRSKYFHGLLQEVLEVARPLAEEHKGDQLAASTKELVARLASTDRFIPSARWTLGRLSATTPSSHRGATYTAPW